VLAQPYARGNANATGNTIPQCWWNIPKRGLVVRGTFLSPEQEWQNSAIFKVWHTLCNVGGMGRNGSDLTQEGNKMTFTNDFTARISAAFAAVAVTTTILVSSFSHPEASIIASVFA
jgi:hypothetical protein